MNKLSLLALSLGTLMSTLSFANANFTITTAPGTTLPTTVSKGGTVNAFFLIKNNTHSARMGYTVKGLPSTVKQYSGSKDFCTNPVNLAALAQCILRLDIQGPVKGAFALCHGASCTTSANALNVTQSAALSQLLIAPGHYIDPQTTKHPLLAQSQNEGRNWTYVKSIQDLNKAALMGSSCSQSICIASGNISMPISASSTTTAPLIVFSTDRGTNWSVAPNSNLPTDYANSGQLFLPSCSDNLCVAAGAYRSLNADGSLKFKPLIRVSQDKGKTWSSPASTYQNLPSGFLNGRVVSASCSGKLCIAAGRYGDQGSGASRPLLALTKDGGSTWSYPTEIQNTPANFQSGQFIGTSCSGTVCVASNVYNINDEQTRPLLIVTQDGGTHWKYPASIQNVPAGTTRSVLSSPTCSGKLCIAVGYFQREDDTFPLLALSNNQGSTWTYPEQIYDAVPQDSTDAQFLSASCDKTLCIAAGYFTAGTKKPMLAVSYDSGATWSYPPAIYNNLPSDYIGNASFLYGANCKDSICTAIGHYDYGSGSSKPLLILSTDGGHSWAYPAQITSPSTLPSNFISGYFSLQEE